jgi:hypothetical protein
MDRKEDAGEASGKAAAAPKDARTCERGPDKRGIGGRRRKADTQLTDWVVHQGFEARVTCDALHVALVATRLQTAWHSGALTAEKAMRVMARTLSELRAWQAAAEAEPPDSVDVSSAPMELEDLLSTRSPP